MSRIDFLCIEPLYEKRSTAKTLMLFIILILVHLYLAATSSVIDTSDSLVAVYWGQNLAEDDYATNRPPLTLIDVCKDDDVDIVLISFIDTFPRTPNPASIIENSISVLRDKFSSKFIYTASKLANHIRKCRLQYGKKVLFSVGGETGNYNFHSSNLAKAFADSLWRVLETPPFHAAGIDGFDLDIEQPSHQYYDTFVEQLRARFGDIYISGSPQCILPEENMQSLLETVKFDWLFVQFYNNDCNANSKGFNWEEWANFSLGRLFMGLPGSRVAAENGFIHSPKILQSKINTIRDISPHRFAGISIWEASLAQRLHKGSSYIHTVKKALVGQKKTFTLHGPKTAHLVFKQLVTCACFWLFVTIGM